jgi:hypothetical protein
MTISAGLHIHPDHQGPSVSGVQHPGRRPDIADTLHLSIRTVENHLQHAYTKLGVTTRRELAHTLGTHTKSTVPEQ